MRGDPLGCLHHALPAKGGNHFINKSLSRFEQGDFEESHVDSNPEKRLQEDREFAVHIKQALRAMRDTFN